MKHIRLILTAIALLATCVGAYAGNILRFGPKVGVEVNSMRLNSEIFDSDNRAGFTGGLMLEANVPVIGLSFDLSVMYVHRVNYNSIKVIDYGPNEKDLVTNENYKKRDYIELPLNIKYRFSLPVVGNIVSPYVFTGPSIAFLTSSKAISEAYENKSFDVSWNVGAGVQLFSHLQIGASYGFGITKTVKNIGLTNNAVDVTGRSNYWTVTAAWLF